MRQSHPRSSTPSVHTPLLSPPCPRPTAHHHFSRCHLGWIQQDGTMTWGLRRGGGGGGRGRGRGSSPPSSTSSTSTRTHARDASLPLSPGQVSSAAGFQLPQQQLRQERKAARGAVSEAAVISASSHVAGSKVSLRRALGQVNTEVHRSINTHRRNTSVGIHLSGLHISACLSIFVRV